MPNQVRIRAALGDLARSCAVELGFGNLDLAFMKNTLVPTISDQVAVSFERKFFDLPNHPNFRFQSGAGQNVFTSSGVVSPTAAEITSTAGAEVVGGSHRDPVWGEGSFLILASGWEKL
jgi:hypothetical protein